MSGQNGRDHAARLEAALDRIARAASGPQCQLHEGRAEATNADPSLPELAARLDGVIAHLRAVLGTEA